MPTISRFYGVVIRMYHNEHSPPPRLKVHPRVVVSVATGFIRGGYTVDQLLDGWHRQGAALGIRELAHRMLDAHIHRIVIVDEHGHPVGIVSSTDVLAAVARLGETA